MRAIFLSRHVATAAGLLLLGALGAPSSIARSPATRESDNLPKPPPGRRWELAWHDEFEGTRLDKSKWEIPEYKRRDARWGHRAIRLDGKGHLEIRIFRDGDEFYDGCVRTRGRFEHAFGYYVARIRLQRSPGHWTAFWLYNKSVCRIGDQGRDGTEIDIMEKPWIDDRVQHTLHWDGYGKHHRSKGHVSRNPGIMRGFHTFALLWTPREYVFYVDGKERWRTRAGGVCQAPLYIKLSDEAQFKGWAGDVRKAHLPDEFLVDYVRVYDLVDAQTGKRAWRPARRPPPAKQP